MSYKLILHINLLMLFMALLNGFDKGQELDMGADDYLVKPFGMMEMVSRIKAVYDGRGPSAS